MRCLISTLIGTSKSCSVIMHAHEHITPDVGSYIGVLMRIPIYEVSYKHAHRHTKIMQCGHKHAHEHITPDVGTYMAVLMSSGVGRPSFFFWGGGEVNAEGVRPSRGVRGHASLKILKSRVPEMRFSSILGVKSCRIPKIIKYIEDINFPRHFYLELNKLEKSP